MKKIFIVFFLTLLLSFIYEVHCQDQNNLNRLISNLEERGEKSGKSMDTLISMGGRILPNLLEAFYKIKFPPHYDRDLNTYTGLFIVIGRIVDNDPPLLKNLISSSFQLFRKAQEEIKIEIIQFVSSFEIKSHQDKIPILLDLLKSEVSSKQYDDYSDSQLFIAANLSKIADLGLEKANSIVTQLYNRINSEKGDYRKILISQLISLAKQKVSNKAILYLKKLYKVEKNIEIKNIISEVL
jgi:hypothetical protein